MAEAEERSSKRIGGAPRPSRGCLLGGIIGIGLVVGLVLILAAISPSWFSVPFLNRPFRDVTDVIALNQGGDGRLPDLVIVSEPPGATIEDSGGVRPSSVPVYFSYTTGEPDGRQLQWEAELGRTQSDQGLPEFNVVAGEAALFITIDDRLNALDKGSGDLIWESPLSDLVDGRCQGCLQVVDDVVVVLTVDNVLQAFEQRTGERLWRVRLVEDTPAYTGEGRVAYAAAGGMVAILDRVEVDGRSREALLLYAVENGELLRYLVPTCSSWTVIELALVDRGTNEVLFVEPGSTSDALCVQSWDLESGRLNWETSLESSIDLPSDVRDLMLVGARAGHVAFGPEYIYLGGEDHVQDMDGVILGFGKEGQVPSVIISEMDHELSPVAATEDTLLVHARRTRGSERNEIWAVDTSTGERLWDFELALDQRFGVDTFSSPLWDAFLAPEGLVVMQVGPEDGRLTFQRLDPRSGKILFENEEKIGGYTLFIQEAIWTNSGAYLLINGGLYALDYGRLALEQE